METNSTEKKPRSGKPATMVALRIHRDLKKKIVQELSKINKKDFGKQVKANEYLSLALALVTPEHLQQLQDASLTNADRLERDYRSYVSQKGPVSKDAYLGMRLSGEGV